MKLLHTILLGFLCIICCQSVLSQSGVGLEGIDVETYYISTLQDQTDYGIPVGSRTYRVYVNMLPGYSLQAVFGSPSINPDVDSLVIYSSAPFWNDPTNGSYSANDMVNSILTTGAAMVDSWFSFGSGGGNRKGMLKIDDIDGGLATLLLNTNPQMGQSLTIADGRFNNTPNALVATFIGADLAMAPYDAFNNTIVSNRFSTATLPSGFGLYDNGGQSAIGAGTDNRVLIGQFTTTGNFGFILNLQLGTPTPGVSEVYVAQSPQAGEFTHPSLIRRPTRIFNEQNIAAIVTNSNNSNTTANVIELDKNLAGQTIPIQSIAIDSVRVSASATSTLYGSANNDGTLFCLTGAKSTNISSNVNTLNPRVVVSVNNSGNAKIRTSYTGTSGQQTRSATSLDSTTFYIADQAGQYTNGSTSASPSGNLRGIKSFGGIIYVGRASSTSTIAQVSTSSAPTGGTITNLPGIPNNNSFQDFYLISSTNNGVYDILYTLVATSNTAGSVSKYSLVSGSWVANGSYTTSFGGFGICAETTMGGAFIYMTTGQGALSANSLIKLNDTAGHNATINIITGNNITLYTSDPETIIKGLAFAPKSIKPNVNLSASTNSGTEAGMTVITVTATTNVPVITNQTVSLNVSGTGITAMDYVLSNSSITIPSGNASGSITFTIADDSDIEGNETAALSISSVSSGLVLGNTISQNIQIIDNDFAPVPTVNLSASANSGAEGDPTAILFTATTSVPVMGNQTVDVNITGTNITNGDYTITSPMITILDGQSTGTIQFTVVDDILIEGTETAVATISNPSSGIALGATTAQNIVITDNDLPMITLSTSLSMGNEASSTKIDIIATTNVPVTSNQTVNLAITGTNITATDYYLSNAIITILAGQTSGQVSMTIADDGVQEIDETAILTLSNPSAGIVLGSPTEQNILIKNNACTFMRKLSTITSANGSEIPAFDPVSDRLYIVAGSTVEYFNVSNSGVLTLGGAITPSFSIPANHTALPNSVSIKNGNLAIAYAIVHNTTAAQDSGIVAMHNASDGMFINAKKVGYLPDMIVFSPDGSKILTANEGEPNSYNQGNSFDPEGSVSIIDISNGIMNASVQHATFTAYNGQEIALRSQGIRIYGPGANASKDFEPEYICFSNDGSTAYISLQENNALAMLNMTNGTITSIVPLGLKNHNTAGKGLDASDQDVAPNKINIQNWPIFGMYQPDAIASFSVGGQNYLITANEGDSRAYTGYSEEIRVGAVGYVLDPTVFPNASTLKINANLGRLQLTNATGDTDGDGDFDRIDALGARSFSIWNSSGILVYDSGDQIENITALKTPTLFNSDGTLSSFDGRSDNKGPEPEGVSIGYIDNKPYAFIGLERTGDIIVFDVSIPASPTFVQYINTPEDLGVEGLIFVKDTESPTSRPLVITSSEVSKTTTIYEIGTSIVTNSADSGSGTLREVVGCTIDGGTVLYDQPATVTSILSNVLTINKNLTIQGLNAGAKPSITVDFSGLGNQSGVIIDGGKTVILKDLDFIDLNNAQSNSIIDIYNGTVKISGSTTITKTN